MTDELKKDTDTKHKISMKASFEPITTIGGITGTPWSSSDVDRYGFPKKISYKELVSKSRFFYSHDPIAATVINKLIDIGISEIEFYQEDVSDNEFRIFTGLKKDLQRFIEDCALEYLISGLVIPEIKFTSVPTSVIKDYGVKMKSSLRLPTEMWVRDSSKIKVNRLFIIGDKSYFVEIPEDVIHFIQTGGEYPDGTKDQELYRKMVELYPEFVDKVKKGEKYLLLEDPYVIERRVMSNEAYPQPYLQPAIESLQHKRNIRKMDYSIASRVISAIQKVTLGDKDFPLTEDDEWQLNNLKQQMLWRDGTNSNQERIFQLFGNHTLNIEWIFPPVEALLDEGKYKDINDDILFGLGFPRILITGESEKTGTSQPEYAILSPLKTMENMRAKFASLLEYIIKGVAEHNGLSKLPVVKFTKINLHNYLTFLESLGKLYESGNLSREAYAEAYGFDLKTQLEKRKREQEMLDEYGLDEFSPLPHSNVPDKKPENNSKTVKEDKNE